MKRPIILIAILTIFVGLLIACGTEQHTADEARATTEDTSNETANVSQPNDDGDNVTEIKFGATAGPYSDQIKLGIKPILEKQGYTVSIVEFNDYVQPNIALDKGDINVNVFQHIVYLEAFSKEHQLDLSPSIQVPTAPIGLYSEKHSSIDELADGMTITMPNDATNQARSLLVLEQLGVITLKDGIDPLQASEKDIAKNPLNLQILPLEAAQLPRSLKDADFAFVNGNFALASGLKLEEALVLEDTPDEYMNIVAFRTEDKDKQFAKDIEAAYQSDEFKALVEKEFQGFVKPAYLK